MKKRILRLACVGFLGMVLVSQADEFDVSGLIGYYKLDDSAGSLTAVDSSGKGYDATVDEGNSSAPNTFGVAGKVGTAWHSDSDGKPWASMTSDILRLPVGENDELKLLGGGAYTISGWFKPQDLVASGNVHLFSNSTAPGSIGVTVTLFTGVHFPPGDPEDSSVALNQLDSELFEMFPPPNFDDLIDINYWYFWCVSFDPEADEDQDPDKGVAYIYLVREDVSFLDGDSDFASAGISAGNSAPRIGRFDAPGAFDGFWDEITIWNRSLAEAEVEALFDLGVAGQPLPASSPPPVTTVTHSVVQVNDAVGLRLQTEDGGSYTLQHRADQGEGSWEATAYRILGNGSEIGLFDEAGPDAGRVYRVLQE